MLKISEMRVIYKYKIYKKNYEIYEIEIYHYRDRIKIYLMLRVEKLNLIIKIINNNNNIKRI